GLLAVAAIGAVVSAQFSSALDKPLARVALTPVGRTAVEDAHSETLARVDPGETGVEVAAAVEDASVHAFHVGIGIAAVLVALGDVPRFRALSAARRHAASPALASPPRRGRAARVQAGSRARAHAARRAAVDRRGRGAGPARSRSGGLLHEPAGARAPDRRA